MEKFHIQTSTEITGNSGEHFTRDGERGVVGEVGDAGEGGRKGDVGDAEAEVGSCNSWHRRPKMLNKWMKRDEHIHICKNAVARNSSSFSVFGVPLMISETDFSVAGLGLWQVVWCAPVSIPWCPPASTASLPVSSPREGQ